MQKLFTSALFISIFGAAGFAVSPTTAAMDSSLIAKLEANAQGDHRSEKNVARNRYRHPLATMAFFGLKADMTVLEISPGGGWYTEILAPSMRDTGTYIAGSYDPQIKDQPEYRYKQHDALLKRIEDQAGLYGQIQVANYSPPESRKLGQNDSVDMVVTFRSTHGWLRTGIVNDVYADFFKVLKPGGTLGVVQHRAPEGDDAVAWAKKGYVSEASVIQAAESAGFVLDGKSEINANAKDLKDHEKGVWRLPPTLRLGEQDREKYLAIGESDRMTLRFKKPAK